MMRPIVFSLVTLLDGIPAAAAGVTATAGNTTATVNFTAPADGGSAITGYTVIASSGVTTTGAASPITVTGLTNNTLYSFRVIATNANGDGPASAQSNIVTPTNTAPAAPSKLVGTPSAAIVDPPTVRLTWTQNSNNETGFTIQRSANTAFTTVATFHTGAGITAYTDTTVARGTKYYYRVQANNAVGDSPFSNIAAVKTLP